MILANGSQTPCSNDEYPCSNVKFELVREKTNNLGFRPGPTQTGLYSHRSRLETLNFGFKKKKELYYPCSENKGVISFRVTAKLVCAFVFLYANCWFSNAAAHLLFEHEGVFCLFVNRFDSYVHDINV